MVLTALDLSRTKDMIKQLAKAIGDKMIAFKNIKTIKKTDLFDDYSTQQSLAHSS